MLTLKIEIDGETEGDLTQAIAEVSRKVEAGFRSGRDRNNAGSYSFEVSGQELEVSGHWGELYYSDFSRAVEEGLGDEPDSSVIYSVVQNRLNDENSVFMDCGTKEEVLELFLEGFKKEVEAKPSE